MYAEDDLQPGRVVEVGAVALTVEEFVDGNACTVRLRSTNYILFRFLYLLLYLAKIEDMAKRRTLLEDERLNPTFQ